MSSQLLDRRSFLTRAALLGGTAAGLGLLAACGKGGGPLSCNDTSALKPDEIGVRTSLGYADVSPDPTKICSGCALYQAGAPDACGGCQIMKGPINPGGHCNSWAKKA